jgi:hypothetical protein
MNKEIVTISFKLWPNQAAVLREICKLEDEKLEEYVKWCVIRNVEMDIDNLKSGGVVGEAMAARLKEQWGPESVDWKDEGVEEEEKDDICKP